MTQNKKQDRKICEICNKEINSMDFMCEHYKYNEEIGEVEIW